MVRKISSETHRNFRETLGFKKVKSEGAKGLRRGEEMTRGMTMGGLGKTGKSDRFFSVGYH